MKIKIYLSDLLINIFAQTVILFFGFISLVISDFAIIGWLLVLVGYSFLLAKLEQNNNKKSNSFKHYIIWVMLPPNIIALAVSICLFMVGASSSALSNNIIIGILVFVGSFSITLLSIFFCRIF